MNRDTLLKFGQLLLIIAVCVVFDQWSKHLAHSRLATHDGGWFHHSVQLTVDDSMDGKTVRDVVKKEFGGWNSDGEINDILRGVTTDGAVLLPANRIVKAGDVIEVRQRKIVIIKDYFDFEYTRNPGAAFSFLADMDRRYRSPFFIITGIIALCVIVWIVHGATWSQQILLFGLSLVAGGAIGNLIDRVRFDYVIDFIVWKYTDANRWPTFNLADAFICVGVVLMVIEMIRDGRREKQENAAKESS